MIRRVKNPYPYSYPVQVNISPLAYEYIPLKDVKKKMANHRSKRSITQQICVFFSHPRTKKSLVHRNIDKLNNKHTLSGRADIRYSRLKNSFFHRNPACVNLLLLLANCIEFHSDHHMYSYSYWYIGNLHIWCNCKLK